MAELILALDLPTRGDALALLDRLSGVGWVKLGSVLMTAEGPALVRELIARGHRVFLDLKWHDIPNTVAGAVRAAGGLGVAMATVHAVGGAEMLTAAAKAAPASLSLVGVTVLTSHPKQQPKDSTDHEREESQQSQSERSVTSVGDVVEEVERLAKLAMGSGLAGVVCSALEAARVRAALGPNALIVVPGIRRVGDPADDQQRTASAGEAARAGATHLVIGRSVIHSADPAAAWQALREEVEGI